MRLVFHIDVTMIISIELLEQHDSASILITEQGNGCIHPLLKISEADDVAKGLDAVQDTVGPAECLNQAVHPQVLVDPQGIQCCCIKAGQEHVDHDQEIQFLIQTDIAFEFASWISVEFRLYLVMEFQRLKAKEQELLGWTAKRELSKINYRIHTDAIKSHLIPEEITSAQASIIYAEEADVLNVAMFSLTAKQWREANPELKGNIRDYATINELICLSNMENINAVLINDGVPQGERLVKLNQIAIQQMRVLNDNEGRKLLK